MSEAFAQVVNALDEDAFLALYGRWDPMLPEAAAELLAGSGVHWWIAGGRAVRIGAPDRAHDDTDLVVSLTDLTELREVLSGWHLWEANDGTLRPLLPEICLLHKARLDRPKDRAGLAAARLDPAARSWLAATLARLGYPAWADLAAAESPPST
jgi:hypothetical protein